MCILLPLVAAGCTEAPRAALEGQVIYADQPVAAGVLRFFPLDDTEGFGTAATIQDGKYVVTIDDGLFAGRYRIEVRATETTGLLNLPNEGISGETKPQELRYEYIPSRYNDQSKLEATLTPGANHHDLKLPRDQEWERQRDADIPDWIRKTLRRGP